MLTGPTGSERDPIPRNIPQGLLNEGLGFGVSGLSGFRAVL